MGSVFRNESALSPEFLPEILPFREPHIKQIAGNLESAADGKRGQNTFVFGPPGIGKTATVRFIFRKFDEEYPGVKSVYINCWDFNTSIAVMSKITTELGMFVSRRGLGKDEVSQRFSEAVSKSKGGIVVCLDEVDQLILKEPGALYSLLRVGQYTGKDLTLVMISNDPHILSRLESRVMSSMNADEVEFRPYKIDEMKSILSERAKLAFASVEPAVVLLAANHAVQRGGDVRIGLQCLQRAGRLAESGGSAKVMTRHVRETLTDVKDSRKEFVKKKIGDDERAILRIVNRSESLPFTELYEKYSKSVENPASVRMVQDYVKHLVQSRMVRLSERKVGGKRLVLKV